MKKLIAALISIAAIVLPQSAIAQYSTPHKYIDGFGKTKIYIPKTADTIVDVITESSKEYTFTANFCGWINIRESVTRKIKSFSNSTNSITVNNFSSPNFVHTLSPVCTWRKDSNTWDFWDGIAPGVDAPNGSLWKISNTSSYFIKIASVYSSPGGIQGTVTYENIIKNKINSCGYGTITVSATRPMTTFKIAGVDYTLANLPVADKPMICRTQGNSKIRYVPLNP